MTENMKLFLEKISEDRELAARIAGMDSNAIMAEARRQGIELTDADFASESDAELSEDELNEVAGGGKCACVAGGGGTEGDNCDKCFCIVAGEGSFSDGAQRCECGIAGGGVDH